MNTWRRIPLRLRLTLLFVPGLALVLVVVAVFTVQRTSRDLLDTVDAGLRSRAEVLTAEVRAHGPILADIRSDLIENDEAFTQIADGAGSVVQSSAIVAGQPLLPAPTTRNVGAARFFDRRIPGIDGVTRILAVPVVARSERWVVAVGASLQDRRDQIVDLTRTLGVGLPAGLLLVSLAGWLLTGAALRPVERMRSQAAAIATSDVSGRLSPGPAQDEIARLAGTLNAMLDRVNEAMERERRFVNNASHELRTPLSILRTELDLALSRPRPVAELTQALRGASQETDHLMRLAEDLLVLSRARDGDLPTSPQPTALPDLLAETVSRHQARCDAAGIRISVEAAPCIVHVDPVRVRQAIDNLLDNAVRHTPAGGHIDVLAQIDDRTVRISVTDTGSGFTPAGIGEAFEPFTRSSDHAGAGLGLAIVRVITEAHGGAVSAANTSNGGAQVVMTLPAAG